ncbi:hypothetical protein Hdeb2414_s0001g00006991 [Helianthus debilis subsp. tardiflorus]
MREQVISCLVSLRTHFSFKTSLARSSSSVSKQLLCLEISKILHQMELLTYHVPPNNEAPPKKKSSENTKESPLPGADKAENEPLEANEAMEEESSTTTASNTITESTEFLGLDHVSIPSVSLTTVSCFRGRQNIQILHRDTPLQIQYDALKVRFGLSTRFIDHAGRARLSLVVDASSNLCGVLFVLECFSQPLITW